MVFYFNARIAANLTQMFRQKNPGSEEKEPSIVNLGLKYDIRLTRFILEQESIFLNLKIVNNETTWW